MEGQDSTPKNQSTETQTTMAGQNCPKETGSRKNAQAFPTVDFKPIKVDNWGTFLMHTFNNLFSREEFCDLELVFKDDRRLMVHSLVVYSFSQFFRVELGKPKSGRTIEMPEALTLDVVKPVIQFMYLGRLKHPDFDPLYNAAKLLGVDVVIRLMENQIHQSMARAKLAEEEAAKRLTSGPSPYRISDDLPSFNTLQRSTAIFKCSSSSLKEARREDSSSTVAHTSQTSRLENPGSSDKSLLLPNEERDVDITGAASEKGALPTNGNVSSRDNSGTLRVEKPALKPQSSDNTSETKHPSPGSAKKSKKKAQNTNRVSDALKRRVNPRTVPSTKYNEPVNKLKVADVFRKYSNAEVNHSDTASSSSSPLNKSLTSIVQKMIQDKPDLLKDQKKVKVQVQETSAMGNKRIVCITLKKVETDGKKSIQITLSPTKSDQMESISTQGPWKCQLCKNGEEQLEFDSYFDCRTHHRIVHGQKFNPKTCDRCGYKFSKRLTLAHHQLAKHGIGSKTHQFPQCRKCQYVALNEDTLMRHDKKHVREKSYACSLWKGSGDKVRQIHYKVGESSIKRKLQHSRPIKNVEEENIERVNLRNQQQELQNVQTCNEEEEEQEEEGDDEDEMEEEEESEEESEVSTTEDLILDQSSLRVPMIANSSSHCPVVGQEPSTMLPTFQELRCSLPSSNDHDSGDDHETMQVVNVLMPQSGSELVEHMPNFLILSEGQQDFQVCDATSIVPSMHPNLNMDCGFLQNGGQWFYSDRCQQQQQQQFQFLSPQDHHHHQEQQQQQYSDVYHHPQPLNTSFGMQDCGGVNGGGTFMQHNQYNNSSAPPLLYGSTFQISPQLTTMQQQQQQQCLQFNESLPPM